MVLSGKPMRPYRKLSPLTRAQLGAAQAICTKGGYQENHAIRSFYVLSTNITRDEATEILQP